MPPRSGRKPLACRAIAGLALIAPLAPAASAQVLDKQAVLDRQSSWDNRDWAWYKANIPFFECPDPEFEATYYYRWELVTKHLTYGSPATGYTFTEFIDRPFWSGAYGAISCPAGHQLDEVRWLRDPRFGRDFARYWFRTSGAQPRRYSTWLADAIWGLHRVHPDDRFLVDLLPDLVANYEAWERGHFAPEVGLFWQTGHDDGMEININSRQTADDVRGAPAYRPTLNSYLWADARAIARVARLEGDAALAEQFEAKAASIKENFQKKLWGGDRRFFFPMARRDEAKDGHVVKAGSLTYQTGKFAGSPHGREAIGFVPWQFGLPDAGFEAAWSSLMDPDSFLAPFGPTTVERHDPLFRVTETCCWWSGQSWPYATTQTLVGLANLLNDYRQDAVTRADYFELLRIYTLTHRKAGRPYIAEGANPDTGSWKGYDTPGHSDHYFHSAYNNLIITGLVGLRPRDDETIEVNPLAPDAWPYFALDDVPYRGRSVAIVWDKAGTRYGLGPGLHVLADGREIASAPTLRKLTAPLPPPRAKAASGPALVNYAVNNDGTYYPRASASFNSRMGTPANATDGNYWYHESPPNRWTTEGSYGERDWFAVDFGIGRRVREVKLYLLDDGERTGVRAPRRIELEFWDGRNWATVPGQARAPDLPTGHRANRITFPDLETERIRAGFLHHAAARTGLAEFEVWGEPESPYRPAPSPTDNLATNRKGEGFPKASASFTSRFDKVAMANDGVTSLRPTPHNRWTAYESPNATDWLEIDFGAEKEFGRVELSLYDDRGGVQPPASYAVQVPDGDAWRDVPDQARSPERPGGGMADRVTFPPVKARKVRVVFQHASPARSGVSEIEVWRR